MNFFARQCSNIFVRADWTIEKSKIAATFQHRTISEAKRAVKRSLERVRATGIYDRIGS